MTNLPTVHVFETNALGHHPFFLAWLLTDPPRERLWILHTTAAVRAHPVLTILLSQPHPAVHVIDIPRCPEEPQRKSTRALLAYICGKASAFRRSWRRHAHPGDVAFIPSYDEFAVVYACFPWLTSGMSFTTIGMRAQFHQQRQGIVTASHQRGARLKEFLLRRVLLRSEFKFYLTNQLPLKQDVDRHWGALARKVRFYPDPAAEAHILEPAEARRQLGLPSECRLVLCYGSLTDRKGIDYLLNALEDPAWPAHTAAICAGRYREGVQALLTSVRAKNLVRLGKLHLREGFVSDERENLLFQAATAVWLVYDGHDAMSGCLVQAGMHRRPVIGCANGLIQWYLTTSRGGVVYRPAQQAASVAAVAALVTDSQACAQAGERLHEQFQDHTLAVFRACIYAAIQNKTEPKTW